MNKIDLTTYYKITRITDRNEKDRKDGRYHMRIGRRCKFVFDPVVGDPMLLEYCPRDGEDYTGILRTSTVGWFQLSLFDDEFVVVTKNSIWHFVEEIN